MEIREISRRAPHRQHAATNGNIVAYEAATHSNRGHVMALCVAVSVAFVADAHRSISQKIVATASAWPIAREPMNEAETASCSQRRKPPTLRFSVTLVHPHLSYRKEKVVNGERYRVSFTPSFTGERYIFRAFAGTSFTPSFTTKGVNDFD
jgi:hypothetical protein